MSHLLFISSLLIYLTSSAALGAYKCNGVFNNLSPKPQLFDLARQKPFSEVLLGQVFHVPYFHMPGSYMPSYVLEAALRDVPKVPEPFGQWKTKKPGIVDNQYLTSTGLALKRAMQGKVVIDLGSGIPSVSKVPRLFAELLGARSYTGVDLNNIKKDYSIQNEFYRQNFTSSFVRSDILAFLSSYERTEPVTFFLEGLQVDERSSAQEQAASIEYLFAVADQLARICQPGDAIFIGRVVSVIHPKKDMHPDWDGPYYDLSDRGFKRIESSYTGPGPYPEVSAPTPFRMNVWIKK